MRATYKTLIILLALSVTTAAHARPSITVITDVLIPATATNAHTPASRNVVPVPYAVLPGQPGLTFNCPTGYTQPTSTGRFAICKQDDNWCTGTRPLCVKSETINPDALVTANPPVNVRSVVSGIFATKGACGANAALAGKIPDCQGGRCLSVWNVCFRRSNLNLRNGGWYLSRLTLSPHALHVSPPACSRGVRTATFVDGGNNRLSGYQSACEERSQLSNMPAAPVPPAAIRIERQPQNFFTNAPGKVSFSVFASVNRAGRALSYRWQKQVGASWQNIPGFASPEYFFELGPSDVLVASEQAYRVVVSAPGTPTISSVTSEPASLGVKGVAPPPIPPRIVCDSLPVPYVMQEDLRARFSISCSVDIQNARLSYQWFAASVRASQAGWQPIGLDAPELNLQFTEADLINYSPTVFRVEVSVASPSNSGVRPFRSDKVSLLVPDQLLPDPSLFPAEIYVGSPPQHSALTDDRAVIGAVASINRRVPLIFTWQVNEGGNQWRNIGSADTWAATEVAPPEEGSPFEPYSGSLSINLDGMSEAAKSSFVATKSFRLVLSAPGSGASDVTTDKVFLFERPPPPNDGTKWGARYLFY